VLCFASLYGQFDCRRVRSARFRVPRYLAFTPFVGRLWAASVLRQCVDLDSLLRDAWWLHRHRIRLATGPVVRLGPGRETFSTAPTARSTCPGVRRPRYVDFPNPAFASSGTLPSRRPVERLRPGSVVCFPRASRPFSTPKSRLRGTRSRVTPLLGLPPFCDRTRPGSVGVFPGPYDLSRLRRADFTGPALA
jgi:hypothetical protein